MSIKSIKLCILGGGWSNEREISLKSATDVYECLKDNGHNVVFYDMKKDLPSELLKFLKQNMIDLVFNLIHGEGGEDGKIQSYLDSLNIDYCGSNASASFTSFNKKLTKKIWIENGLTTPRYEVYNSQSYEYCMKEFGPEFFIKDTCSGSSNNIYLIRNNNDYSLFNLDHNPQREYIIEEKIHADEYTATEQKQLEKNKELEKEEGFEDLSYNDKEAKGYKHVCTFMSTWEKNDNGQMHDPLVEPLAKRIEGYAVNEITEEVAK